jgi:endonuclease/exonuclease/phosphatase family metal-dependent hydrolase
LYPHELNSPETTLKSHFFSRDVAELRFFKPDESKPSLVILLTHLKSKLDPEGKDFEGKLRRAAELKTLLQIYQDVKSETENQVPIIIAGDFNGQAHRVSCEPEFEPLLQTTDLREVLTLVDYGLENRVSQIQFPRDGSRRLLQLDYIFVSPHLEDKLIKDGTFIYRFKSDLKVELPLPASIDQSNTLPSDHYPVVATFKNFLF